jgi:PPOX class probable F420-dependent enzyme
MENPLESPKPFDNHQYINVETFRKSGVGVRTPVWFVEHNGELCFATEAGSSKVKRLRRNAAVMVAPCQPNGDLLGSWHPARARFLTADETRGVKKVYARKYGVMKFFFDVMGLFRKSERVFIALTLDAQ